MTYRQVRSRQFRHLFRDAYVWAGLPDSLHLRCRAARLVLPQRAIFCGPTAARLCGIPVPDDDHRLHVAVPAGDPRPEIAGIQTHRYNWTTEQLWRYDGWSMPRPEPLYLELAACLRRLDLIIAGDQIVRSLTGRDRIAAVLTRQKGRRGLSLARACLADLEPDSWSPMETRLRLLIVDAGLPRPVANAIVLDDDGGYLAQPDLQYRAERIAIYYDGKHHDRDERQRDTDRERINALGQAGWLPLRYDARTFYRFPHKIISDVRQALMDRNLQLVPDL